VINISQYSRSSHT